VGQPASEQTLLGNSLEGSSSLGFFAAKYYRNDFCMSSTWLCSRNDLMANAGVLMAAGGSYVLMSRWPDILVGVVLASVFLSSALQILRQARQELRTPLAVQHPVELMTIELPHGRP
jgi:Co/Zn/Cd efflux system component